MPAMFTPYVDAGSTLTTGDAYPRVRVTPALLSRARLLGAGTTNGGVEMPATFTRYLEAGYPDF
jgi:hypothetical protein